MSNSGYRKMLPQCPAFLSDPDDLYQLALSMTEPPRAVADTDDETSREISAVGGAGNLRQPSFSGHKGFEVVGPPAQETPESDVPAGYTYLGQFIDHDISLDSRSDRFVPGDLPWTLINPASIRNLRNPVLDLETIYGSGSYPLSYLLEKDSSRLRLGYTFGEPSSLSSLRSYPNDLPRQFGSAMARIVDQRNDENVIIAQTQVAFMKFHNAIVRVLGDPDSMAVYEKARRIAIRHYQYIILRDFLPKIVIKRVLHEVIGEILMGRKGFYGATPCDKFIPLEFAVGAYRMGHSMVRNEYQHNPIQPSAGIRQISMFTGRGQMNGNEDGLDQLPSPWIINWRAFYDIDGSKNSGVFNFAKKIDTKYSSSLGALRPMGPSSGPSNSLSTLDLFRGQALGLPSGQALARAMKVRPLDGEVIARSFDPILPPRQRALFQRKTPLLFYLLAEAGYQSDGQTLGYIGSRIVAETFVRLLYMSPFSILKNHLESDPDFLSPDGEVFGMPEMLKFIADTSVNDFDELGPIQATPIKKKTTKAQTK